MSDDYFRASFEQGRVQVQVFCTGDNVQTKDALRLINKREVVPSGYTFDRYDLDDLISVLVAARASLESRR